VESSKHVKTVLIMRVRSRKCDFRGSKNYGRL